MYIIVCLDLVFCMYFIQFYSCRILHLECILNDVFVYVLCWHVYLVWNAWPATSVLPCLQCVAAWFGVLQRLEVWNMWAATCVLQCVAVCCSALQCVAVCCSVLHCVAVCCSVLKMRAKFHARYQWSVFALGLQCVAVCCSVLQWVAVCCEVLQTSTFHEQYGVAMSSHRISSLL